MAVIIFPLGYSLWSMVCTKWHVYIPPDIGLDRIQYPTIRCQLASNGLRSPLMDRQSHLSTNPEPLHQHRSCLKENDFNCQNKSSCSLIKYSRINNAAWCRTTVFPATLRIRPNWNRHFLQNCWLRPIYKRSNHGNKLNFHSHAKEQCGSHTFA